jgi:exopolysaccharide production protein ExoZ
MTLKAELGTVLPIQYLRGVAAMMVVYHHSKNQIPAFEAYLPGYFGVLGVDIFFVISGFIMYVTTANTAVSTGGFVLRRIIRIVPLYWLLTSVMCLIWVLAPALFKTLTVTPRTFLQSLFFVPHYSLSFPENISPLLVPGWTLNFEMFFYAAFAIALLLPRRLLAVSVVVFILALVLFGRIAGPFDSAILTTYTHPMLLEFAAGVVVGKFWLNNREGLPTLAGTALFLAGWGVLVFGDMLLLGKYSDVLGATWVVAGSLNAAFLGWRNRLLKILGDATYAIYLSHIFTLGIFRMVWLRIFGAESFTLNAYGYAASAMLISLLVGVLIWKYLENPLTRYLNHRCFGSFPRGNARPA